MRFRFRISESAITLVCGEEYLETAKNAVRESRSVIEEKIGSDPFFRVTYDPYPENPADDDLIRRMCRASESAGVGPMAGVAGAVAVYTAEKVREAGAGIVIVENGGDIAFFSEEPVPVVIYADDGVFKNIGFLMRSDRITGVCSSSARIGPSVSLGSSDLCTVFSDDVILADCCATTLGNMVRSPADLEKSVEKTGSVKGVRGCMAVCGGKVAMFGDIPEMIPADCSGIPGPYRSHLFRSGSPD